MRLGHGMAYEYVGNIMKTDCYTPTMTGVVGVREVLDRGTNFILDMVKGPEVGLWMHLGGPFPDVDDIEQQMVAQQRIDEE